MLYALISVALWSTVATGFKLGLRVLQPVQLLFLGCVVALAFFAAARPFVSAPMSLRRHLAAAALGLLNPLAYYLVLGLGLAATLGVTMLVTRMARRSLSQITGE